MRNNYTLKKAVLTAAIVSGGMLGLHAQIPLRNPVGQKTTTGAHTGPGSYEFHVCPSDKLTDRYIQENGLQALALQGEIERQNTSTQESSERAVRTVPVVFHVVYRTNGENVSDAVINNLLLRLNQDFRKNNSLIGNIRPSFTGVAADAQIEFCLATKDPNGNAATGITRTQTTMTYFNPDATNVSGTVGGQNSMKTATYGRAPWDRTKYVNIWICNITNGATSGTAGYAYVPQGTTTAGLPGATIDGIVLDYNIGVQGGNSRAVSHEMGHYFGLPHTWGDATGTCNTGDDGFTDTPTIKGPYQNYYSSCASGSTAQSCTAGTLWQYENLMDYSNCFCMFTTQQANRMNAVLSGSRNTLNTSYTTNCAQPVVVAPVANFTGCSSTVPQNSVVTFTDASTNAPATWAWTITPATGWAYVGGTSATSQNPQVQFTTQGNYTVALTVTNSAGSNTKTSSNCITVVAPAPCNDLTTALVMGFEANEDLTGWLVENTNNDQNSDGDDNTWGIFENQTGLTAHGGTRMIGYLYNDDGVTSANDWFYTPCLSLVANQQYSLSFWYKVTASGGVTYAEKMRVKIGNTALSTAMTQTIVDLGSRTNTAWVQSTTTFTVAATGSYNVGFQCYSDADKLLLAVDDINISRVAAVPVANFTGCTNTSVGSTVTFTNTSTNSPTSYSWSITPATGWSYSGGTSATSANPQVTFTTAGSYTVALTATNSAGTNTKTSSACVVVSATQLAPVADFTGCTSTSVNNTVTFTNTSTNSPTSYAWSITPATGWSYAGGTSASSANPQVLFTTAGSYTVALTATNATGSNTKTSSACVVISNTQTAPVANFTGCGSITVNNTVTFTNTSTNSPTGNSWTITPATGWSYTGGTSATSTNPQVTFTAAGNYTVVLTATNAAGSNTKTSNNCVVVTAAQSAPVADFTGCGNLAVNGTVTFTNTSTNSPTSNSWSITPATGWSFTGGTSATSYNPQVTFTATGTYTVVLTATNAAGSNTKTSNSCVVVSAGQPAPVADFTGCAGTVASNTTVTFNNTSTNSPTSNMWTITPNTGWTFVNGTNANSVSPQVTFMGVGVYTVSLTATNAAGSDTKTSTSCVIVQGSGIVDEAFSAGISLFPNPSGGMVTLSIGNAALYSNVRINVFNAVGVLLYQGANQPGTSDISLDLSAFSAGVYFVEVRSDEAVATKRLVLNK